MKHGIDRRAFLGSLGASAVPAVAKGARPNILFAIADDWSWPFASIAGDRTLRTPAFDRVAREGVLFTHAYAVAPTCTASRGSILTGQWFARLEQGYRERTHWLVWLNRDSRWRSLSDDPRFASLVKRIGLPK